MPTLLPIITLSLLALGCQSPRQAPWVIELGTPSAETNVHVTAHITSYSLNATEEYHRDSRPPEIFDALALTLLSPSSFAKRDLRVAITAPKEKFWQQRRGVVEFTISDSDLSNVLKPDSRDHRFDGALHGVNFRQ